MILIKKVCFIAVLMFMVLLIALCGNLCEPLNEVSFGVNCKPQIILDAGHAALENTID